MDKSSRPNWSYDIFTVTKVIPKQGSRAEKYRIDAPNFEDKIFTRNDLQLVNEKELQELPEPSQQKQYKVTSKQQKEVAEGSSIKICFGSSLNQLYWQNK